MFRNEPMPGHRSAVYEHELRVGSTAALRDGDAMQRTVLRQAQDSRKLGMSLPHPPIALSLSKGRFSPSQGLKFDPNPPVLAPATWPATNLLDCARTRWTHRAFDPLRPNTFPKVRFS